MFIQGQIVLFLETAELFWLLFKKKKKISPRQAPGMENFSLRGTSSAGVIAASEDGCCARQASNSPGRRQRRELVAPPAPPSPPSPPSRAWNLAVRPSPPAARRARGSPRPGSGPGERRPPATRLRVGPRRPRPRPRRAPPRAAPPAPGGPRRAGTATRQGLRSLPLAGGAAGRARGGGERARRGGLGSAPGAAG